MTLLRAELSCWLSWTRPGWQVGRYYCSQRNTTVLPVLPPPPPPEPTTTARRLYFATTSGLDQLGYNK